MINLLNYTFEKIKQFNMSKFLILIASIFTSVMISAQTASPFYTFSLGTNTYTELDNPTFLTDSNEPWDDPQLTIPFDFPFQFFGNTISAFYTSFGTGTDLYTTNDFNASNTAILTPMLLDVVDRGYNDDASLSSISYKVVGNLGNRILKLQWKNVGLFDDLDLNETSTDFLNFQVWFFETSNKIEMHYGPSFIADVDFYSDYAVALMKNIGLDNETIEDIHYLSGMSSSPSLNITSDIDEFLDNSLDGIPAPNTVYIFNPIENTGNVKEIDLNANVDVYPNPSTTTIAITSDSKIVSAAIKDISGRSLFVESKNFSTISLENLDAGNYVLEVQTEKGIASKKITKL